MRTSIDMFSTKPESDHPFGAELTKVNELAEEIGARDVLVLDDDEQFLMSRELCKFGAEDYVDEIPVHYCMDLDSSTDARLGTGLSGKWIDFSFFVDSLSSTNGFATALLGTSCKGYEGRLGQK
ncbi:hypothetical protein OEA41_001067 [Lepraria neglecta]|uniref:Uncharacterized protein n=1 Tax=Lepraria neglecta TaxID=209136 RepID=A0AAE0DQ12_9LECA|nr:hypothetical protein OEA41_001067 [Lepraria neglecta]